MQKTIAIVVLSVIAAICWADAWTPTPAAAQPPVAQKDKGMPQLACPDPDDSTVGYVSPEPSVCADIRFTCKPGEILFSNHCGCGCIGNQKSCPDPNNPAVSYVSQEPSVCARIRFTCVPGETLFSDFCGCGCITPHIKGELPLHPDGDADAPPIPDPLPPDAAAAWAELLAPGWAGSGTISGAAITASTC